MELSVKPGMMQKWTELSVEAKEIVDSHGTELRFLQAYMGGPPSTIMAISAFEDINAFAKAATGIATDARMQDLQARMANEGAPVAELVTSNLYNNIDDEVGGAAVALEDPQLFHGMRFRVNAGKRAKWVNLVKQIRQARSGLGLPVYNVSEVIVGDTGVFLVGAAYKSLEDWAATSGTQQPPEVLEIIDRAQNDGDFPFSENLGSRLMMNITG
jgi:hypothetical protein